MYFSNRFSFLFFFFPQRLRFEYLLRIDALSASSSNPEQEFGSSVRVEEDASLPGFIHLKILGIGAKEIWREYVDVAGRLRRDLVKARLANLLATSIKQGIFHSNQLFKGCVCVRVSYGMRSGISSVDRQIGIK